MVCILLICSLITTIATSLQSSEPQLPPLSPADIAKRYRAASAAAFTEDDTKQQAEHFNRLVPLKSYAHDEKTYKQLCALIETHLSKDVTSMIVGYLKKSYPDWEVEKTFDFKDKLQVALDWSPCGKRIAICEKATNFIQLLDSESGACAHILTGHTITPKDEILWSPCGKRIATRSFKTIQIWNSKNDTCQHTLNHDQGINHIAWSPNGTALVASDGCPSIKMWDIPTGTCTKTIMHHRHSVRGIAYSPSGEYVASAGSDSLHNGHSVRIWKAEDGTLIRTLTHYQPVWSVTWSPDEDHIISGGDDGEITIWNTTNGESRHMPHEHTYWVQKLFCSPNKRLLTSMDAGSVVKLWDMTNDECIWKNDWSKIIHGFSWSPCSTKFAILVVDTIRIHGAMIKYDVGKVHEEQAPCTK